MGDNSFPMKYWPIMLLSQHLTSLLFYGCSDTTMAYLIEMGMVVMYAGDDISFIKIKSVLAFHSVPSTIFQIPANNDSQTT
jgi:hypothetical protein